MDEQTLHSHEEVLAARRATLVRAEILGLDNQPLSTGTATPVSEGVREMIRCTAANSSMHFHF